MMRPSILLAVLLAGLLAGCGAVDTIDWHGAADGWLRALCREYSNVDCHGDYQRHPTLRNHAGARE